MNEDEEYLKAIDPNEYYRRLSNKSGIDVEKLEDFGEDYDFVLKGQYSPDEDQVAFVSEEKAARDIGLPLDHIQHLQQFDVINLQLTYRDLHFLRQYRMAVEDQGGGVKLKYQRPRSLEHPAIKEAYQKWIYKYYLHHKTDKRIYVGRVAGEVSDLFGIPYGKTLCDEIKTIRVIVYNDRRKSIERDLQLDEIEEQRLGDIETIRNSLEL